MSDGGTEFAAETESLMRAYDVFHEVVPPSAKWRMGWLRGTELCLSC